MLKLNLQFFAEGAEGTEAAEPSAEETVETSVETEEASGEPEEAEVAKPQSSEDNARFAAARRQADAQAKAIRQQQQALDNEFAALFSGYTNPVTGQPIRTAQDYLQAMQAQMKDQRDKQLKDAGLDPSIIDRAVEQSPVIRQAAAVIKQHNDETATRALQEDIQKVIELDPTVNNEQDVLTQPNIGDVLSLVRQRNLRFDEAYKLVNFERLSGVQAQAAKQSAINSAKSKEHLSTTGGMHGQSEGVDIPAAQLKQWKSWFPDKSAKELRALYNKAKGD